MVQRVQDEQVLELPPVTDHTIKVVLDQADRMFYNRVRCEPTLVFRSRQSAHILIDASKLLRSAAGM